MTEHPDSRVCSVQLTIDNCYWLLYCYVLMSMHFVNATINFCFAQCECSLIYWWIDRNEMNEGMNEYSNRTFKLSKVNIVTKQQTQARRMHKSIHKKVTMQQNRIFEYFSPEYFFNHFSAFANHKNQKRKHIDLNSSNITIWRILLGDWVLAGLVWAPIC